MKCGLKNRFVQLLVVAYFCLTFLVWPFISGGVISGIGSFCDNFERLGSWKIVAKFYPGSTAAEEIETFNAVVEFAKHDSSSSDVFITLTGKNNGHHFKLATVRKGIGDVAEYGTQERESEINSLYSLMYSPSPENLKNFKEALNRYGATYILLEKCVSKNLPYAEELSFKEVYRNPRYTVYKLVK